MSGLLFSFLSPFSFLLEFANDDSFYYLKTAYNFSNGNGSTFDLVNFTNGYHPLWFFLLSLYFFIINNFTNFSPELYYRMVVLLTFVICSITLFVQYRIAKINLPVQATKYILLFSPLYLLFVFTRDFGMETHLICFIISVYILLKSLEMVSQVSHTNLKCLLLGCLLLARIDFLITVIPVIITVDFFTSNVNIRRKFFTTSSIVILIIAAIYFSSNYYFFGHIMTVSSQIKNSFPETVFIKNLTVLTHSGTLTNQFAKTIYCSLVILIFIILMSIDKYRNRFKNVDLFILGICSGALIFLIFNIALNKHSLKEWYVAFPAFVCSMLLVRMILLFKNIYYPALVIFTAAFIYHFTITRLNNPKWQNTYEYAKQIQKITEPDDRIFQIDLSGIVGYFSERKVINGDGLINSFEYLEYLNRNDLKSYLKKMDIDYYSTHSTNKGDFKIEKTGKLFIDSYYANNFGGYPFEFPESNLKFRFPYYYYFAVNSDSGEWYLFEF